MTTAIFLTAESGLQLDGITWNPQILLPGEEVRIRAETLLWHLNTHDARLVRNLFPKPTAQPLSLLPDSLARDTRGLGRSREEALERAALSESGSILLPELHEAANSQTDL